MTVNREVRERGERNGSACRRRACRRTGRQRSFKGVQSGRLAGFSAFAFKVRAVQSGGGNRRHAPRRHAVTPTPTRLTPTRRYVPRHSGAILPRDCLISDLCSLDFRISRRSARGRLELRRRSCSLAALRWAACRFRVSSISEMSRLTASWRLRY
jgi:hypothetical protein